MMGNARLTAMWKSTGAFTTEVPEDMKDEDSKWGGSQSKAEVPMMAGSEEVGNPKNPGSPKKVGHIKMAVIPYLKSNVITPINGECSDAEASVVIDATRFHVKSLEMFGEYAGRVIRIDEIGKVLPWVHVAIANAKTRLPTYHEIKLEFLQGYLNGFHYKNNFRYFGERLSDSMPVAYASYAPDFKIRVYDSILADTVSLSVSERGR